MNKQSETASEGALKIFQDNSWTSSTVNKGLLSMERAEPEGQGGHFHSLADH